MLGFERNEMKHGVFRVNGCSVAENSWIDGVTGAGVVALPSNLSRFVRAHCN